MQSPVEDKAKKEKSELGPPYEIIYRGRNIKYELSVGKEDLKITKSNDGKIITKQYGRVRDEKIIWNIEQKGKKWVMLGKGNNSYYIYIQKDNDMKNTGNYKLMKKVKGKENEKRDSRDYIYYTKRRK